MPLRANSLPIPRATASASRAKTVSSPGPDQARQESGESGQIVHDARIGT
jgi:hypothetical protein